MGNLFKHLTDFIKDRTTSWGFKTALFVTIISLVFITDFYLGFSFNFYMNNKIEQIENIKKLQRYNQSDSLIINELNEMERTVITRKHYSYRLSRLFLKDSIKSETSDIIDQNKPQNNNATIITNNPIRTKFWMTLSSSFILLFTFILLLFMPAYDSNFRKGNGLLGWFASLIFLSLLILIVIWVAYQIPLIYNKPYLNYILNSIIHLFFTYILIKISSKN